MPNRPALARHAAGAVLALCTAQAIAQPPYKVVGPDGRVTYTDRPPTGATETRIGTLSAAAVPTGDAALPLELRQITARYPVTLYVTGDDCGPCNAARELLRQRGVPFAERTVQTPEDALALERLSGGREAPTATIGAQVLLGLAPSVWNSYLDAAGYPRESRLPVSYRYPPALPLVARAAPAASAAEPAPAPDAPPAPPSLPISSGPIRF